MDHPVTVDVSPFIETLTPAAVGRSGRPQRLPDAAREATAVAAGRSPAGGGADRGAGDRRGSQPMWDMEAARGGHRAAAHRPAPAKKRENQPGLHGAPTLPARC